MRLHGRQPLQLMCVCTPFPLPAMQQQNTPCGQVRLSVDDFEKAIDTLELLHFDAVKAWWEEQQSGECSSPVTVMVKLHLV